MKQLKILIGLCIIMFGCTPGAYFKSPNDVSKMDGTIYFLNESTKSGALTIELETNGKQDVFYEPDNFILLTSQNGRKNTF